MHVKNIVLAVIFHVVPNVCGRSKRDDYLDPTDYPYVAHVVVSEEIATHKVESVMGVLISYEWVLTSASAIDQLGLVPVNETCSVVAGVTNYLHQDRGYDIQIPVGKIITHGDYKMEAPNDLALVGLESSFEPSATIRPIKLPSIEGFVEKCRCGRLLSYSESDYAPLRNKIVQATTVYREACPTTPEFRPSEKIICWTSSMDFQQLRGINHTGAPVICRNTLIGVLSLHDERGDATANIIYHLKWISQVTRIKVTLSADFKDDDDVSDENKLGTRTQSNGYC